MPAPATTKGMKAILDKITEEVIQSVSKLTPKLKETGGQLEVSGGLTVDGDFEYDREGNVRFSGKVKATVPTSLPVDLGIEVGPSAGKKWESEGKAHMKIAYAVKYKANAKEV